MRLGQSAVPARGNATAAEGTMTRGSLRGHNKRRAKQQGESHRLEEELLDVVLINFHLGVNDILFAGLSVFLRQQKATVKRKATLVFWQCDGISCATLSCQAWPRMVHSCVELKGYSNPRWRTRT